MFTVGYRLSRKERSGSGFICLFPVSALISSRLSSIFPKGEMYFSVSSQGASDGHIHILAQVLAVSLSESSVRRTSNGLTFNSTSRASLPLVPKAPKHKARPFLCTPSDLVASAHCHTGQAYSRTGSTKTLYNCISFSVLMFSTYIVTV